MCKEAEADDPFQLNAIGVPDPTGEGLRAMAACFAEEFLRLGFPPGRVLALFESPRYALAHQAYRALGARAVRDLVDELARVWSPAARKAATT